MKTANSIKLLLPLLFLLSTAFNYHAFAQQKFEKSAFYSVMSTGNTEAIDNEITIVQSAEMKHKDGYEGALLMKKAGLAGPPKQKLKLFKEGRIKLETAIMDDNDNTEFHFLRLAIEEHAPKIVKYHNDMENDKAVIQKNFKSLSPAVQQAILDYCKKIKGASRTGIITLHPMTKKVLAIYYTQSGQMGEIINTLTSPLVEAGIAVEKVVIKPVEDYNFPWTGQRFFSVMPDCVLGVPSPLEPLVFKEEKYDLIIMAYQPWFLSPSIPNSSLLQNDTFKALLQNTPVVTISAARNMWINAYVRVRNMLKEAGANLVGNIALVDKHPNPVSFITIFYWMLSGKKERYLNVFPKPGIAEEDILHTEVFGKTVGDYLSKNSWDGLQDDLLKDGAVAIKYPLMFIEARAKPIFSVWAKIIAKRKNQVPWLAAFKYYLFIALFLGAPVLLTLDAVFLRPFSSNRIKAKKLKYLQVNN